MKLPVLAAAAVLIGAPVVAQPPPSGWVGPLTQPSILCDTSEQLQSIVDAFEESAEAGKQRLVELFNLMNSRQEPTCAVVAIQMARTSGSTDLGRLSIAGADVYGWILHVENRVGEGYFLYLESPQDALRDTI
jgi:hypothetical protein